MSEPPIWPSGVGGAQCDDCDETTIVRRFGDYDLCRACYEGWDDEDEAAADLAGGEQSE